MHVFFHTESKTLIDGVRPDGLGVYSGKTQAELAEEYKGEVVVMESDAAQALHEAKYIEAPKEITEAQFWYWLEVLPPCQWVRRHDSESFHMSEFTTGQITRIVVRIGTRYFDFEDTYKLTHEERVQRCLPIYKGKVSE